MMSFASRIMQGLLLVCLVVTLLPHEALAQQDANSDQFTYRDESSTSPNYQYPPNQWRKVRCGDLETCIGWPDKFLAAPDWSLETNDCEWCPAGGNSCGTHHQSPINLERNRAVSSSQYYNQCIDVHRMNFADSSCTFDELIRLDAFSIQRHALQIKQPIKKARRTGQYRNACMKDGKYRWGKLDYSKGFSNWWWLSHTDIHVPSEHTQNGKRYDAEIQMYQFYSVNATVAGIPNQMGTVSIFLQAYNDAGDYDVLNKLICQWRRVEEETREQCGLSSVTTAYSGCDSYTRGASAFNSNRNLRKTAPQAQSAYDVLTEAMENIDNDPLSMYVPLTMPDSEDMEDSDFDNSDYDVYRDQGRNLASYDTVPWHNYFGLLDVKTEYYFRYSGSQTIPPCYGVFLKGSMNRASTNHWRVMKDPIRISYRQLNELHRLLKSRIAPSNDPIRPCQADTAGRPYDGNSNWINVTRPLQATHKAHYKVFCECRWKSRFAEDQKWCSDSNQENRLYKHPYNFDHKGF